jgi:hypothetical protein
MGLEIARNTLLSSAWSSQLVLEYITAMPVYASTSEQLPVRIQPKLKVSRVRSLLFLPRKLPASPNLHINTILISIRSQKLELVLNIGW